MVANLCFLGSYGHGLRRLRGKDNSEKQTAHRFRAKLPNDDEFLNNKFKLFGERRDELVRESTHKAGGEQLSVSILGLVSIKPGVCVCVCVGGLQCLTQTAFTHWLYLGKPLDGFTISLTSVAEFHSHKAMTVVPRAHKSRCGVLEGLGNTKKVKLGSSSIIWLTSTDRLIIIRIIVDHNTNDRNNCLAYSARSFSLCWRRISASA